MNQFESPHLVVDNGEPTQETRLEQSPEGEVERVLEALESLEISRKQMREYLEHVDHRIFTGLLATTEKGNLESAWEMMLEKRMERLVNRAKEDVADAGIETTETRIAEEIADKVRGSKDTLTGFWRRDAYDTLARKFEGQDRRTEEHREKVVIFIDFDHFKQVNDTLGHDVGDVVIREISNAVRTAVQENIRGGDEILVRPGGDELVVLARVADAKDATVVAEKIRAAIEARNLYGVTGSIGFVRMQENEGLVAALARADAAAYRSKKEGRNRVTDGDSGIDFNTGYREAGLV